jgi:hypothetical protein
VHASPRARTTGATAAIEDAGLGGCLALGKDSPWYAYLRPLLPDRELVPLVWPADEAERLPAGTELDKVGASLVRPRRQELDVSRTPLLRHCLHAAHYVGRQTEPQDSCAFTNQATDTLSLTSAGPTELF